MFSGIVETTSPILSIRAQERVRRVRIKKPARWKLSAGQSIAIDGICSTVVSHARSFFDVEYMPETLAKTTAAFFRKDSLVNLERSLVYGDRIDGHLMQGHVDAKVRVAATVDRGRSRELIIACPRLMQRVILHGSIALNGVSLTVARWRGTTFVVALIPHTIRHTNLGHVSLGDMVNIETDKTTSLAKKSARGRVIGNAPKENSHHYLYASKRRRRNY